MSTGNRYSKKFKEHAIRLITEEGMPKAQVARDLGVTYQTLINWTKQHEKAEDSEKQKIDHRKLYQKRKETIERIFGTAKENHGLRYTQYVGKALMNMKVGLTFACMNMKKLAMILP